MEPIQRTHPIEEPCLFDVPRNLPRWESLPLRTRQEVVQLLEKILIDYGYKPVEARAAREESSSE